jgi:hypothetical protein
MNFWLTKTKIFALSILLFTFFITANAQDSIYKLPVGTKIRLRMDNEINSKVSNANDTFTATLSKPLIVKETILIPSGTIIEGKILKSESASVGGKNGVMEIRFETIRFADGIKREIDGVLVEELKVSSSQTTNILSVIGGTAIGAIFGAVSKSNNGALIGAGVGAGAGTGFALLRKGKEVRIKSEQEFEIELKKEVVLPVKDY